MKIPIITALLLAASAVHGAPAEIAIIVDTSASMAKPSSVAGKSKLDVARDIARRVAEAADKKGHRVGLLRYRQQPAKIRTGQGEKIVFTEAPDQCSVGADILVDVERNQLASIQAWTSPPQLGDPSERLVAVGDSPLLRSVQFALRYIRARRQLAPTRSCVNAWLVVITDGEDTCAAGAQLKNALDELRKQSVKEDIRALVIAFKGDGEAVELIAKLGHESDAKAKPFAISEADALVTRVGQIAGRVAPEACLLSGVKREEITPGAPDAGADAGPGQTDGAQGGDDGGGCAVGAGALRVPLALGCLLGLLVVLGRARRRSRWRTFALVACLAAIALLSLACGDDTQPVVPDDGGVSDAAPPVIDDPDKVATETLKRFDDAVAALAKVRETHVKPLVDTSAAFAAIKGDKKLGCFALARAIGYEPYVGAKLGAAGCLATRRCNALDQAILLRDCLAFHKITAAIETCSASTVAPLEAKLRAAATAPVAPVDLAPAYAALQSVLETTLKNEPDKLAEIKAMGDKTGTIAVDGTLDTVVDEDFKRLEPLINNIDPKTTTVAANKRLAHGLQRFSYVVVGTEYLDPVLSDAPSTQSPCNGAPAQIDASAAKVTVELLVSYIDGTFLMNEVSAGTIEYMPHEHYGQKLALSIVDASTQTQPDGLPRPSKSGCYVAYLKVGSETVKTKPFFVIAEDNADCNGVATAVAATPGRDLHRVIMRTTISTPRAVARTRDRVLIDRYSYIKSSLDVISGPTFSSKAARRLLPMRVELLAGAGIPGKHKLLDIALGDVAARADVYRAQLATRLSVAHPEPAPSRAPPVAWTTLGLFARKAHAQAPGDLWLLSRAPSALSVVMRRGFSARKGGLEIAPQTIFDILDLPFFVIGPADTAAAAEHDKRFDANLRLGLLATESERIAVAAIERSMSILNAGQMLRDDKSGAWAEWGSDAAHEASNFPLPVRWAQRDASKTNEQIIVTPGAVRVGGDSDYVAWWRVNKDSGQATGEVRYEGTFYGGAIVVAEFVANFVKCLAFQAIVALKGGRIHPDVQCCKEFAAGQALKALVLAWIQGTALGGLAHAYPGTTMANGIGVYKKWNKHLGQLKAPIKGLDLLSDPPPCIKLIPPGQ